MHLTNWAYNIGEMNITMSSETITMDSYKISAEWDITRTKVSRYDVFALLPLTQNIVETTPNL